MPNFDIGRIISQHHQGSENIQSLSDDLFGCESESAEPLPDLPKLMGANPKGSCEISDKGTRSVQTSKASDKAVKVPEKKILKRPTRKKAFDNEEVSSLKNQIVELLTEVKGLTGDLATTAQSNTNNLERVAFFKTQKERMVEELPVFANRLLCSAEYQQAFIRVQKRAMSLGAQRVSKKVHAKNPGVPI